MTPDELRALADTLHWVQYTADWQACDQAADYLRAQADAQPALAVPAGWKLVPVEPTPEMLSAVGMMDGYDWHAPGCSPDADHANWYSAMIAAAPAVPQAEPKRKDQSLRDLLAVIHRDGGHHTEAVGIEQSIKDAQAAVCALKVRLAQAEPKREPLSDERIDAALQTEPVLITRLMIGSMTVGEFKAALRRVARTVEHAHGISGGGHD